MILEFSPQPPFDFKKMMKRLIGAQKTQLVLISDDLTQYERVVRFKGAAFYLRVNSKGSVDEPSILCTAEMIEGDLAEEDMKDAVERIFSLKVDLTEFYQGFAKQNKLSSLCRQFNGLKLVTDTDLFEAITKIIVGQQVNLTFAGTLINRLTDLAGTKIEHNGKSFQLFPEAEKVAMLDYSQLRELQFSQRKAEYIIDLARMAASGTLALDELWHKTDEEIMQILLPIRGIGRWTIECLLIFGMGRPDVLPAADIGLRNGVKLVWDMDHQPSEEEVRELAKDWVPWRTYVTYYLWESLAKEPAVLQIP
ncbi:DNA-3-methyladenine glycosylase family protein [Fictibacillus iocasae]|uniref:DNA-3-methyladenine glycosylase II n=1 Tax=Fictibacillus iocasae TaxID=2715437 RepID=A0ABW2NLH6_9BACL